MGRTRWGAIASGLAALGMSTGTASAGMLFTDGELVHDGEVRTFYYFLPDDLSFEPAPLVLALHGGTGSADQMIGTGAEAAPWSIWMDVAEREKFVVAYPNGFENQWNDCRADAPATGEADDVGFLDALIFQLATLTPIDLDRVYVTGVSNGGMMSFRLGRELTDRLAAIAPVVANRVAVDECAPPAGPIPVMIVDGTDDPLVPWVGGQIANDPTRGTVVSVRQTLETWLTVNGCERQPEVADLPNLAPFDGSTITSYRFDACAESTEVLLYAVLGGGHALPSSDERYSFLAEIILGPQNHDVEGAEEIWSFFSRHRLSDREGTP